MKFTRRVISIIFIFVLVFSSASIFAFAEGEPSASISYPDADKRGIVTAVYASRLGELTSFLSDGVDGGMYNQIEFFNRLWYDPIDKLYEGLFDKIYENTVYDEGAKSLVCTLEGESLAAFRNSLSDVVEILFGEDVLNGSPYDHLIDAGFYINFMDQMVIPWQMNGASNNDANYTNFDLFTKRGDFYIPSYNNMILALSDGPAKLDFHVIAPNGSTVNFKSAGNFEVHSALDDVYIRAVTYTTPTRYLYRDVEASLPGFGADRVRGAFMPVIFYGNPYGGNYYDWFVQVYQFSYVSEGVSPGNWGGSSFYVWRTSGFAGAVKTFPAGNFEISTDGITEDDITFIVNNLNGTTQYFNNVNSVEDITYNYITNNYYVSPPVVDPFDWDTNPGPSIVTPNPDGDGGYTVENPSFHMPDLNINWKIDGLTEKFPFSIPFDIVRFYTILNAEPVTPSLQGSIDLGVYQWDIDFNLHDFDNLASLLRNLEFASFCISLIFATRRII